jgi:hypothetical protein
MSLIKAIGRAAALCLWSCFFTAVAFGDGSPAQASELARHFDAKVMNGELVGWEQRRLVHLKAGTNEMAFAVPHGLRVEVAEDRITLTAADAAFFVNFRIRVEVVTAEKEMEGEIARQRLLRQYAGAKIVDEYQAAALERTGHAYEMRWTPASATERLLRVARIPTAAGTLELTMVAEPGTSADGTFAFNSILTTLCKAHDGKFEVARATGSS